jgi:hypothetical protein
VESRTRLKKGGFGRRADVHGAGVSPCALSVSFSTR